MRSTLGLVAASLSAGAGCSLVIQDRAPAAATSERFVPCDESQGWPVVDTAIALLMTANAAVCVAEEPCDNESEAGKIGAVIGLAAIAAVFGYSAFSGYREAARCKELHLEFAARPQTRPPAPDPGDPELGREGRDCRPGGGCDPGLVCASGLCVRPGGGR